MRPAAGLPQPQRQGDAGGHSALTPDNLPHVPSTACAAAAGRPKTTTGHRPHEGTRPLGAKRAEAPHDRRPRAHAPRRSAPAALKATGGNSPPAAPRMRRSPLSAERRMRRWRPGGAGERGAAIAIPARPGRHRARRRCVGSRRGAGQKRGGAPVPAEAPAGARPRASQPLLVSGEGARG